MEIWWRKRMTDSVEKCKPFRTLPETLCKWDKAKAKKCTPQCYRSKCVSHCKLNQSIMEMCHSLMIWILPESNLESC